MRTSGFHLIMIDVDRVPGIKADCRQAHPCLPVHTCASGIGAWPIYPAPEQPGSLIRNCVISGKESSTGVVMRRLNKSKKETIYTMFAQGDSFERVAENTQISLQRVKNQYLRYLDLSLGEKLRMTLLLESIINRVHRLADDIKDIERIDSLLNAADEKTLLSLLDIKRKIKDRMMKDSSSLPDAAPGAADGGLEDEINEYYRKIFGETDSGKAA
jgi:hypothetical protein